MKFLHIFFLIITSFLSAQGNHSITGEMRIWHKVTITFSGPFVSENDSVNPFTDYRLNVLFTHADTSYLVPGFYSADGKAAETQASSGNKWRVNFTPDKTGLWTFTASFRSGKFISVKLDDSSSIPISFDGTYGSFNINSSNKQSPDFRSKGRLNYIDKHYLQFAGTKEYFLKGGTNSPENFLAYFEFDETPQKHKYEQHNSDWRQDDPTWQNGKGKNIIGVINYLSSKGVNSIYMLTFNVKGDGDDVWMYTDRNERFRFDCSKLDQWEVVFSYMEQKGILCHFVTQETENDHELDNGELGNERKLYYRELIARFGHHLAVEWNLGEENTNTTTQLKSYAEFIHKIDPYDHLVTMHNINYNNFKPLLGYPYFDGPSMYIYKPEDTHKETLKYLNESINNGRAWVCFVDEIGPYNIATPPDNIDYWHDENRKFVLWGNLMAGGAGVEWYMGYDYPHNDLTLEDFRTRDHLWELTTNALEFFKTYLPFEKMQNSDELIDENKNYCFSQENEIYVVYLPNGGTTNITLTDSGTYSVEWFNPRTGGGLNTGSINSIESSGVQSIGFPPDERYKDWAAIIKKEKAGTAAASLKMLLPKTTILNDTSVAAKINIKLLDIEGNLSINANNSVYFDIIGPGELIGNNPVVPQKGYAFVTYSPSNDTGTAIIKAFSHGLISDSVRIRIMNRLVIENFESYQSDSELNSEWLANPSTTILTIDNENGYDGNNSMKVEYQSEEISLSKKLGKNYPGAKYLNFGVKSDFQLSGKITLYGFDEIYWEYYAPQIESDFYQLTLDDFKSGNGISYNNEEIERLEFTFSPEHNNEDATLYLDAISVSSSRITTGVHSEKITYTLYENYPNPFNNSTNIIYYLPEDTKIRLTVYDVLGNLVETLVNGFQTNGQHSVEWNAEKYASGIYFFRILTSDFQATKKGLLLK